nr:hypothetical protein HUO10_005762 [Paraburkholderia busanensis]
MTVVVFVHGTGVRQSDFDVSFDLIKSKVKTHWGFDASSCYWGGELGATLLKQGASIPDYDTTRVNPRDEELTAWELLYRDPLFEIRMQPENEESSRGPIGAQASRVEEIKDALEEKQPGALVEARVANMGLASVWPDAIETLFDMTDFRDFVDTMDDDSEYQEVIARALVALATTLATDKGVPAPSGKVRDALVDAIVTKLGGKHYGLGKWIKNKVRQLAQRQVAKRRGTISDGALPKMGDILAYQVRGKSISEFIKKNVERHQEPVVIVAHSLGGIACLEMMIDESAPANVKALVTVGSQGPLFYELDCLRSLKFGKVLPDSFVRWINVYDKADLLSYVGGKLLPGSVVDVEVENGQPFPESHSAYWQNDDMWRAVCTQLEGVLAQ